VYPSQFEYERPGSVKEAIALLESNPDAKVIAGGHSLLPAMKLRLAMPGTLVDIARIDELHGISVSGESAKIGAATTYLELQDSAELAASHPIIGQVVNVVGDPSVRSRGTLGPSAANKAAGEDTPPSWPIQG